MIKSLRQRQQLWHALILFSVVVLFGGAFYRELYRSTLGEIDADLLSGARVLEGTLRGLPTGIIDEATKSIPLDLPPVVDRRPPPPERQREELRQQPRESSELAREIIVDDRPPFRPPVNPAYFAIFSGDGRLLRSDPPNLSLNWIPVRRPLQFRQFDERREVVLRGPEGLTIVVGRNVEPEMQRLTAALVHLIVIGAGVLSLGLIGGWWLARNGIRPIQRMSDSAQNIGVQNLSERIDTSVMDSELQSLGTTLNSMLDRIEEGFERQSQFIADASHDLRTPIAILLSHCELALSRPRSEEEYQRTLGTCLTTANRMKSLVDGLLMLARSDAKQLHLNLERIELKSLCIETLELFRPFAAERAVRLELEGSEVYCLADRNCISQVIANLVDNAILYNRENGQVTIGTSIADGVAILRIQDSGIGISAEALPHIFDRFYRVDSARARRSSHPAQSGSGLGLAICQSLIKEHQGTLTVISDVDKGSIFEARLPLATPPNLHTHP